MTYTLFGATQWVTQLETPGAQNAALYANMVNGVGANSYGSFQVAENTSNSMTELMFALNGSAVADINAAIKTKAVFAVAGQVSAAAVPEPSTWVMLFAGFAGLGVVARRRAAKRRAAARPLRVLPGASLIRRVFGPLCPEGGDATFYRAGANSAVSPKHLTPGHGTTICGAMADVSFPAAFGAGLISFVSPCVLPLAAPYLRYLAGASVEALADENETQAKRDILVTALLFVAGFSTVFVGLGATASALGECSGNGVMRCRSRPGSA